MVFKMRILSLIFLGLVFWSVNLYFHPDYFNSPDAAIYADTARHILKQGRPLTNTTLPQHLIYFPQPDDKHFYPQYPLIYPSTVAVSFFLFGVSDFSVILSNLFFFLAAIPIVYLLAKQLFNQQIAFASSILYLTNPQLLNAGISGMSETIFGFELLLIFYLLMRNTQKAFFLAGIVFTLSFFTRYQSLVLLLPVIFFIGLIRGKRIKSYLTFLSAAVLSLLVLEVIFPGTIKHYLFTSYYHTQVSLGTDALFPLDISQSLYVIDLSPLLAWNLIIPKILFNFYKLMKEGLFFTVPTLSVLYFLSLFKHYSPTVNRLKRLVLSSLFLLAISLIILIFDLRFIIPLLPVIIIFATDMLYTIFTRFSVANLFPIYLFILFFIILPGLTYNATGTGILRVLSQKELKPTIHQIVAQTIAANIKEDLTIASNEATHITWYALRKTVYLPKTPEDLIRIDRDFIGIGAVVLVSDPFAGSLDHQWAGLVNNPGNFGNFYFSQQLDLKQDENYPQIPVRILIFYPKNKL